MKKMWISIILVANSIGCNYLSYENELTRIKAISIIFDCEEANIHLKIIESEDSALLGTPILPICNDSLCIGELYNLTDTTSQYLIDGFLSRNGHNEFNYGCISSKSIQVKSFEKVY